MAAGCHPDLILIIYIYHLSKICFRIESLKSFYFENKKHGNPQKILIDCLIIKTIHEITTMLTPKIKQQLKAKAHKLKPVVLIGNNGLTDAVNKEIDKALHDHELIKIRIQTNDRELRRELFDQICEKNQADLVQTIGSIGVIYRLLKSQ